METFRFRYSTAGIFFAIFIALIAVPSMADDIANPRQLASMVIDSFCFPKSYGGYLLHSTLPDRRLRLTAEAQSRVVGQHWTLELVVEPAEVDRIWQEALVTSITTSDMKSLLTHCRADNVNLKTGLQKEQFNQSVRNKPAMDKIIQQAAPGFPSIPAQPLQSLSKEEDAALTAWRIDEPAQVATKKLGREVMQAVRSRFMDIGSARTRHIAYVTEDHQSAFERQFFGRASNQSQQRQ